MFTFTMLLNHLFWLCNLLFKQNFQVIFFNLKETRIIQYLYYFKIFVANTLSEDTALIIFKGKFV